MGRAAVHPELFPHCLEGGAHEENPPPRVQGRGGQPAGDGKDPAGQPGKGEHLSVQGDPAAPRGAQGPLGVVGVLLRDNEDLGPCPVRPGHGAEQCGGFAGPRPAQQQLEHGSPPLM